MENDEIPGQATGAWCTVAMDASTLTVPLLQR
jgi:hypothetical protein